MPLAQYVTRDIFITRPLGARSSEISALTSKDLPAPAA